MVLRHACWTLKSILSAKYAVQKQSTRGIAELTQILEKKIDAHRKKIIKFRKEHGTKKVGEVKLNMLYGGMRGILALVCETSYLDPNGGIRFRGYSIEDCMKMLPKINSKAPWIEGVYWLLLTGEIPTVDQVKKMNKYLCDHSELPDYLIKILNDMPKNIHPLSQVSAACNVLGNESKFCKDYRKGMKKVDYWRPALEDCLKLFARIPVLSAKIFRNVYKDGGDIGKMDPSKCVTQNFCEMCGFKDPNFTEVMRIYFILHCDHDCGNVSAHTTHLVGSALSDPYLAYAAGMNGLAGPLHGLANEEVLKFIFLIKDQLGNTPTDEVLLSWLRKHLASGQVIPGYGHAVLRKTDPRFMVEFKYAKENLPNYELVKIAHQLFRVVPPLLQSLKKVANPWPNVDAHSGVLLQYYGMTQYNYYTTLFAISRAMGVLAQLVWNRAMATPIERPRAATTDRLMKMVDAK